MTHSYAEKYEFHCPQCEQNSYADVWLIVDTSERPDLLRQVQANTLHDLQCSLCHHPVGCLEAPLLLFRPEKATLLVFSPAEGMTFEQGRSYVHELVDQLRIRTGYHWRDSWLTNGIPSVSRQQLSQFLSDGAIELDDLSQILQKISQPAISLREMAQRVDLCKQALSQVSRDTDSQMWAALLIELGNSLNQNQLGDRAKNIEAAILAYTRALEVYTRADFPEGWAMTQNNLATVYKDRLRGDRAKNIEAAILAYTRALEVYTKADFPEGWAMTQNNLAIAYTDRLRGDRAENIELAILACTCALEVRTKAAFPEDWALTQNNLAVAYTNRIRGDRAKNIEAAILAYTRALEVYTKADFPEGWAMTQNNLAAVYKDRIREDNLEDIESTIAAYTLVLEVYTRADFPEKWAMTQYNLAGAYKDCIRGDDSENIELAIAAYTCALEVYTRADFPEKWAMTQNSLATAYDHRIQTDKAENIELAIAAYTCALEVYTKVAFPEKWAMIQHSLASAYRKRLRGDSSENIELAIAAYTRALEVYIKVAFPEKWAMTQNNLASTYKDRIQGDSSENTELAIAAYTRALEVYTRVAFPQDWAMTQYNLANAYRERILGGRAQNIELAIAAYTLALEVYTRADFSEYWAKTQNNLAVAYTDRTQGNRAENIEAAISAYSLVLEVHTRASFPEGWATTQNNLANAYKDRIRGDRAENIEAAISACTLALEVRTRAAFPEDWATTQNNLANAYTDRIRGDRAENIELAVLAYNRALEVYTRADFPEKWATTQNNLALVCLHRIRGGRAKNIEFSILTYVLLLQVYTKADFPEDWAKTQNNLAIAYATRIHGDRAENIELAIAAYNCVLEIYTRANFPERWATTQNNLATDYAVRIRGNRAENIESAITAYTLALEVRTRANFPDSCRLTSHQCANLYADEARWVEAASTYTTAIQSAEDLYQSALLKVSQISELSENNDLYRRAAYAYSKTGDVNTAIALLEQGRARGLRETLERNRADLSTIEQQDPDLYQRYRNAAETIQALEAQEQLSSSDERKLSPTERRKQAVVAREALKEAIAQIRKLPNYSNFLALPTFEDVEQSLHPNQTLVYVVTTPNGGLALTVTKSETHTVSVQAIPLEQFPDTKLQKLINNNSAGRWIGAYAPTRKANVVYESDRPIPISDRDRGLWDNVMQPIVKSLSEQNITQATLIPCGLLSVLPLHAAWTPDPSQPTGRRYAIDTVHFTYAPSALSLKAAHEEASKTEAGTLLAINNPTEDLANSEPEVAMAIAQFSQHQTLSHNQADRESVLTALPNHTVVHFSCHGSLSPHSPLDSRLKLANAEAVTLRDFFNIDLQGMRLAILSACETGLSGTELPDEAISLPTGLLQAGVAGIIASLWAVADFSTALLMVKFYDLWRNEGLAPAVALRYAQIWLRDTTVNEKIAYLKLSSEGDGSIPNATAQWFINALKTLYCGQETERIFAHPYYWAAFTYTGA